MFTDARQFLIRCLSPTHAGVGQDIGSVDMPIQREVSTGIPKIEASSFKGSFRGTFEDELANKYFGESNDNENNGAGILGVTDLKLLFYPVKSDDGIYKLVTCSYLLNRFLEDKIIIKSLNKKNVSIPDLEKDFNFNNLRDGQCIVFTESDGKYEKNEENENIVLDEYTFEKNTTDVLDKKECFNVISEILDKNFRKDIVVISNEDFIILEELNREIITRNKIDQNTGTVTDGALFTEEYLPAESILYGLFLYSPLVIEPMVIEPTKFDVVLEKLKKNEIFQIGGNTNLGKGIVKMKILELNVEG